MITQIAGYNDLLEKIDSLELCDLVEAAGVSIDKIKGAVDILAKSKKIIICWAMGLTQHKNAVDNIKECVNLLLLKGSIGIEGGGTCPVRGHSNVQGDRTVGINHHISPSLIQSIQNTFGFKPPHKVSYNQLVSISCPSLRLLAVWGMLILTIGWPLTGKFWAAIMN